MDMTCCKIWILIFFPLFEERELELHVERSKIAWLEFRSYISVYIFFEHARWMNCDQRRVKYHPTRRLKDTATFNCASSLRGREKSKRERIARIINRAKPRARERKRANTRSQGSWGSCQMRVYTGPEYCKCTIWYDISSVAVFYRHRRYHTGLIRPTPIYFL